MNSTRPSLAALTEHCSIGKVSVRCWQPDSGQVRPPSLERISDPRHCGSLWLWPAPFSGGP